MNSCYGEIVSYEISYFFYYFILSFYNNLQIWGLHILFSVQCVWPNRPLKNVPLFLSFLFPCHFHLISTFKQPSFPSIFLRSSPFQLSMEIPAQFWSSNRIFALFLAYASLLCNYLATPFTMVVISSSSTSSSSSSYNRFLHDLSCFRSRNSGRFSRTLLFSPLHFRFRQVRMNSRLSSFTLIAC